MTTYQIRSNIRYNEDILDQLQIEKREIERKLEELDALKGKVSNLQLRFGDKQEQRKTMLLGAARSTVQNKILGIYHDGMSGLLNGTEFNGAYEGLSESKQRINAQIAVLDGELSRCNENIAYRNGRCEYWRDQLAIALAEEAE